VGERKLGPEVYLGGARDNHGDAAQRLRRRWTDEGSDRCGDRPEENGFGIPRLGFREGRREEEAVEGRRGRAAGGNRKGFRYKGCGRGFSSEERFAVWFGALGFCRLNRAGLVLTNMVGYDLF
jgi:hypothetical protein